MSLTLKRRLVVNSYSTYSTLKQRHLRSLSGLSSKVELKKKVPQESAENDVAFFKRLGKTANPFWIANAADLFSRLEWKRLLEPSADFLLNLRRRGLGEDKVDLKGIRAMWEELNKTTDTEKRSQLVENLVTKALWVPNDTHKASSALDGDLPHPIYVYGAPSSSNNVLEFQKYCDKHNFLRNDNLGNIAYHRSYYTKGPLAELEGALVRYSLEAVRKAGFQLISVPDIIFPHVIESCGMRTRSDRDQIFWLELPDSKNTEACLSGTSEMSIAGSLQNVILEEKDLPLRLAAVSRCFRAETSSVDEERGIYRVHEFTKVELFGVTSNENGTESNALHEEFRALEESLFSQLGLHFKTLEMPPIELGLPAHRKFDIEAWMPGRRMYGEISSTSNCTDFQSRRLNIRYRPTGTSPTNNDNLKFAHTVNGTACAIPRMLISLIETFQKEDGKVEMPPVLQNFMSRSWEESCEAFSKSAYKSMFLRTKSSQEKYTSHFRDMEL